MSWGIGENFCTPKAVQRVHRERGVDRALNLGSQREQITIQLWIYFQNLQFLPNLALVWPKFDLIWSIWLILCQLYGISQYSVALFHQNLKLGADFTFKMAISPSILQVDPIESLLRDLESSIHMAWELWFIYSLACHTLPGIQEGTF